MLDQTHEHKPGDRVAYACHGFEYFGTVIADHTGDGDRFVQVTPDNFGVPGSLFVPRTDFTWTNARGAFTTV